MIPPLRGYQLDAVAAVREQWESGVTRTAVVHATGLGKTSIIAAMAADEVATGGRVLILTHRGEILEQLIERCRLYAPGVPVGKIQAETNQLRCPIAVAMVPSLSGRLRAVRVAQDVLSINPQDRAGQRDLVRRRARLPQKPTLVICDEAHHSAATTWMAVLRWAGSFDHVKTLGLTATLVRAGRKGLGLGDVWESVADERDIKWGIDNGWLVPLRGRAVVVDHMDLDHAKVSKGDYQDNEIGEMVEQDTAQIVKAWSEHASDRITIAFCPTVAAATALSAEFAMAGVPVGLVVGTTRPADRHHLYAQLGRGEIRVLCAVMVPTEGWDCPPVSCILQCRPTRLPGLFAQIVGRGARLHPGKADCLVLDVVGASRFQRLATLVDLVKGAEYDDSEIEVLPCRECGELPATCLCEPAEGPGRDPSGTRRRLLGPAVYDDVDLFASSELVWLFTRAGVRFLPVGDRIAVLWDNGDETFDAGHCATRGRVDGEWIGTGLSLDWARELAETWALDYAPTIARRGASWRKGSPTDKQLSRAVSLGIPSPETMDKARLSDEISIVIASRILDRVW